MILVERHSVIGLATSMASRDCMLGTNETITENEIPIFESDFPLS